MTTITLTFTTEPLNLTPGDKEHARAVVESYLRSKGVVQEHLEEGKYMWGWRSLEVKEETV